MLFFVIHNSKSRVFGVFIICGATMECPTVSKSIEIMTSNVFVVPQTLLNRKIFSLHAIYQKQCANPHR